jgi:hypothetical protein
MATRRTKGAKGLYLDLAPELIEALKERARESGRTLGEECEYRLRATAPQIPGANGVEPVKRPRGRPRKERKEEG